ncbi:MAG: hypothetical protein WD669_12490 [Pirellulales bacterium]
MDRLTAVRSFVVSLAGSMVMLAALASTTTMTGCDRKEKVIEINTPNKEIEVNRDRGTNRIEVEVKDK